VRLNHIRLPAIPLTGRACARAFELARSCGVAWTRATADPAVRSGIKFALAGTLALFLALLIRLDEPTWAVTTAFVLSTPKFVGAIAEKTVLRIGGAIAGALIGYLITGSLEQTPILFLASMGLLVGIGTAMYGGTLMPYGFRQCGYTATLVAAQGISNPQFSWHVGTARCQEVILGILVTMVVTTCLWPRYARQEFGAEVRGTLRRLSELFRERAGGFLSGSRAAPADVLGTIGGNLAKLRKMIRIGRMESSAFRDKSTQVDEVVSELGVLMTAISNLGRTLPAESSLRQYIEREAAEMHEVLGLALSSLASPGPLSGSHAALLQRAADGFERYESQLRALRIDGVGKHLPIDESLEHAGYCLSIREILEAIRSLSALLPEIEAVQDGNFPTIRLQKFTPPDAEWIKAGIRGGLAVVAGLFLLDWLHPPGGDILVVGTYLFTGFSLEATGRKGDLGVFRLMMLMGLACLILLVLLLLAAPLMSSYAVMNIILWTFLFLTGYLLEKGVLESFPTLAALLITVIIVGLNAQRPVGFQEIVGPVFGLFLATILSSLLRRLIWPSLPQHVLRDRLARLIGLLEKTASHPDRPVPVPERAQIALLGADAQTLVGVLDGVTLRPETAQKLRAYTRMITRLGGHLMFSAGAPKPPAWQEFRSQDHGLFAQIAESLAVQRGRVVAPGIHAKDLPPITFREWTIACRNRLRGQMPDAPSTIAALGVLYRHEQSAVTANDAAGLARSIDFEEAFSDPVL